MKIRFFKSLLLLIGGSVFFLGVTAKAEAVEVIEPTDFWFQYDTETIFSTHTEQVEGYWSDPMLWLYDQDGQLLAQNDDYYGLQSHIEITLPPGTYRLRAGICCGIPDRWYDNVRYSITVDGYTPQTSTTMEVWTTTTETSTSSSLTSSTTTTTQLTLPTTTSTTVTPPLTTLTVLTTTSLVEVSPVTTVPPPSSSMPSSTMTTAPSVTPIQTTTTVALDFPSPSVTLGVTPAIDTTIPTQTNNYEQSLAKVYVKKVGIGPIHFTLKVSGKQRRTVVVASIIQVTTVASMSVPGVSNGGVTSRRRR